MKTIQLILCLTLAAIAAYAQPARSPLSCLSADGSSISYTCNQSIPGSCLQGFTVNWTPDIANGSNPTLNTGCGPGLILTNEGTAPAASLFTSGIQQTLWYDGRNWRAPALVAGASGGKATGTLGAATVNFSASTHTLPSIVVAVAGSLPGTCTAGELGFVTGATAGQNIYECGAANVWTQQLNSGGGGGGSGTVTSVACNSSFGVNWLTCSFGATPTITPVLQLGLTTGLTANQVLATPNGATGPVGLRSLVAADIPNLSYQAPISDYSTIAALTDYPTTFPPDTTGLIGGSIAVNQVAFGAGPNAIGGASSFTYDATTVGAALFTGLGLNDLTSSGIYTDQALNGGATFTVTMDTPTQTVTLVSTDNPAIITVSDTTGIQTSVGFSGATGTGCSALNGTHVATPIDGTTFSVDFDGTSCTYDASSASAAMVLNTFSWAELGGGAASGVAITTGTPQLLSDGVSVTFGADSGHVTGAYWTVPTGGALVVVAGGFNFYDNAASAGDSSTFYALVGSGGFYLSAQNGGPFTLNAGASAGGSGGAFTMTGGASAGGGGGAFTLTAGSDSATGNGGAFNLTAGNSAGGAGGDIILTPGQGTGGLYGKVEIPNGGLQVSSLSGSYLVFTDSNHVLTSTPPSQLIITEPDGVNPGDSGGAFSLTGGNGNTTGSGGAFTMTGGASAGGGGGAFTLTAGSDSATGNGGAFNLTAGNSAGGGGGAFSLNAGSDSATGRGGAFTMTGGASAGGGGGAFTLTAGSDSATGNGGAFNLTAGNSAGGGGGAFNLTAGNSAGGGGGAFTLTAGSDSATGNGGAFTMNAGNSAGGAGGNIILTPGQGIGGVYGKVNIGTLHGSDTAFTSLDSSGNLGRLPSSLSYDWTTVGSAVFTGSGTNDLTSYGTYTDPANLGAVFQVTITGVNNFSQVITAVSTDNPAIVTVGNTTSLPLSIDVTGVTGVGCDLLNASFLTTPIDGTTFSIPFDGTSCTYVPSSATAAGVNFAQIVGTVSTDNPAIVTVSDTTGLQSLVAFSGVTGAGCGLLDGFHSTTPINGTTFSIDFDGTACTYDASSGFVNGTDTFTWLKNGGGGAAGIQITTAFQALSDGVSVEFGSPVNHTATDHWTVTIANLLTLPPISVPTFSGSGTRYVCVDNTGLIFASASACGGS